MQMLAAGFGLAEGPIPHPDDPQGGVLLTDVLDGGVYAINLDGRDDVSETLPPYLWEGRRGMGGLALRDAGGVIGSGRDLLMSPGDVVLAPRPDGVTGFNDICATPEGGLLAGGLRFRPFAGEKPVPSDLFYVSPTGDFHQWDSGGLLWPNGIGFSPDGKVVYVNDYATGTLWAGSWEPEAPAVLLPHTSSPVGSVDGLAVDEAGNVWVATGEGGMVVVFDAHGELVRTIEVPATFVSSVCHAGADYRTLVVTTMDNTLSPERGGAVFALDVEVPGLALHRVRHSLENRHR